MLEAFSRNGELGHWPKPNRQDPQLPKLHRRHRQIADKILRLKHAIENERPTPQCENVCQEMRSLCTRLLGLEQEYWQRSGNSGLPPTLQSIHGQNFATNATLRDVLDEAFWTREELGIRPLAQVSDMPSLTEKPAQEEPAPAIVIAPEPKDATKQDQNPQREQRLRKLLEHYDKDTPAETDPVAMTDALWEANTERERPFSAEETRWRTVEMREWIPEHEWPTAIRVSQVLRRHGENDLA